jgi:hypothetical protein
MHAYIEQYLAQQVSLSTFILRSYFLHIKVSISFVFYYNFLFLTYLLLLDCQDDEDGPYRGKLIGKFNSYHHQVGGDVYAVDAETFLIVDFNYDGNGIDTFFWSGASNRPGPQGFIVPNEYGK